jgi:hypothetical protein
VRGYPRSDILSRQNPDGRPGTVVRLLDDAATLRAAQDDPAGFVEHDKLMVIDEIQLAPELLRAIKGRRTAAARARGRRSGPFGMIMNLIFVLVMRDIPGNRLPRSLRVVGGRRKCMDGTREDVAESAASSSRR